MWPKKLQSAQADDLSALHFLKIFISDFTSKSSSLICEGKHFSYRCGYVGDPIENGVNPFTEALAKMHFLKRMHFSVEGFSLLSRSIILIPF